MAAPGQHLRAALFNLRASARVCGHSSPRRLPIRLLHATPAAAGNKHLDWYFNAIRDAEAAKGVAPLPVMPPQPLHGRKRARAFMDLSFDRDPEAPTQRVVFELADDIVPLAVQNFLELCVRPVGAGYCGSELFMVRKGFGIMGGDWTLGNGRGGVSSFPGGRPFADENFIVRHSAPGVLSMANSGVHSNKSVFFVGVAPMPHLDGRNVALGRVILGLDVVVRASNAFAVGLKPATPVSIRACGALPAEQWAAVDKAVADAAKAAAAAASGAAAGGKGQKQAKASTKAAAAPVTPPPAAAPAGGAVAAAPGA